MKISTKGRYSVRIMLDLALQTDDKPRLVKDISQSQQISFKYITQLIVDLRLAGLIHSIRGAKGGLKLAKMPENITLLEIIEAAEGEMSIVSCVKDSQCCERHMSCHTQNVWSRLNSEISQSMQKITLAEILESAKAGANCCM